MRISPGCAIWIAPFLFSTLLSAQTSHPLDPLTAAEITRAVEILHHDARFGAETRFALIDLHEPPKKARLASGATRREARALFYNWTSHTASEAVVDLARGELVSWMDHPGNEPPLRLFVISRLSEVVKADPRWREAMGKLGITEYSRIDVIPDLSEDTRLDIQDADRFVTGWPFMVDEWPSSSVAPVSARVNLTRGEVIEVTTEGSWEPSTRSPAELTRDPLLPPEIVQPAGVSFTIEGSEVR